MLGIVFIGCMPSGKIAGSYGTDKHNQVAENQIMLKKNKIKKNEVVFTYANSVHSENEKYSIHTPNKISISEYT